MEFVVQNESGPPIIFLGDKGEPAHWIAQTSGYWTARVFIVRARDFTDAWDYAMEWLHEHAPEEFEYGTELFEEQYAEALKEGMSEEEAYEHASADLIYDDGGYLLSEEWHGGKFANRAELLDFIARYAGYLCG